MVLNGLNGLKELHLNENLIELDGKVIVNRPAVVEGNKLLYTRLPGEPSQ